MTALLVLGGAAGLLALLALTASRPGAPILDEAGYLTVWRSLHGGYDPSGSCSARWWLRVCFRSARPLARLGLQPDVLTLLGLVVSASLVPLADAGGRWPLLGIAVVVLSGLIDNLDGAVAVLTRRTSRFGAVLDSLVDRASDSLYFAALWRLGAPGGWCLALGIVTATQEYARARAFVAGLDRIGVVTVWERPSRVLLLAFTLLGSGLLARHQAATARFGTAVGLGLALAGLVTLVVVIHRRLRVLDPIGQA